MIEIKNLVKIGNSWGVIIPTILLRQMGVKLEKGKSAKIAFNYKDDSVIITKIKDTKELKQNEKTD